MSSPGTTSPSKTSLIYEDTRQQAGRHGMKHTWWSAHGVEVERRKLDTGDYWAEGSVYLVDTKKDVQELAGNVGRDHDRFVRELDRATAEGKLLVILIEEHPEYEDPEALETWVSRVCRRCRRCDPIRDKCIAKRRKPMNGPQLRRILDALSERHGARFMFCEKADTARIVCDLLGVKYAE